MGSTQDIRVLSKRSPGRLHPRRPAWHLPTKEVSVHVVSRFSLAWIGSPVGIGLTLGSLAGIVAFLLGMFSTGPTAGKRAALGAQMQAAGGPPQPEQLTEMGRLQAKLASSSTWGIILATAALALMAVARYL